MSAVHQIPLQAPAGENPLILQSANITLSPEPGGSRVPRTVNQVTVEVTPNMALLNFGFVEPAVLAQLGAKGTNSDAAADELQGLLVARVAMPLDVLAVLHHQTSQLLSSLQRQLGAMLTEISKGAAAGGKVPAKVDSAHA